MMNSEELRKLSQDSRVNFNKDREDKRVNLYQRYLQEVAEFVANNHELFIAYLEKQTYNAVSDGSLTCTISRIVYEDQKAISFGYSWTETAIWEAFFSHINNPYLRDWTQDKAIYLTIKKNRGRKDDFIEWLDYLFHPWPIPSNYETKLDEWIIFIDTRKHTYFYKLLRSILYGHAYYRYSLRSSSNRHKKMKAEGKILNQAAECKNKIMLAKDY